MTVQVIYTGKAKSLNESTRKWVVDSLTYEMPSHEVNNYFSLKYSILESADYFAIAKNGDSCIGIIALSKYHLELGSMLYIETFLISENYQNSGLSFRLISSIFSGVYSELGSFPDFISMKTYNPITYGLLAKFSTVERKNLYPSISLENKDESQKIAIAVASKVAPDNKFDEKTGIVYGGSVGVSDTFWKTPPKTKDEVVNNLFYKNMTPNDRLLCILDTREALAKNLIVKKLKLDSKST